MVPDPGADTAEMRDQAPGYFGGIQGGHGP